MLMVYYCDYRGVHSSCTHLLFSKASCGQRRLAALSLEIVGPIVPQQRGGPAEDPFWCMENKGVLSTLVAPHVRQLS